MDERPHVVIVGAGFGGLRAARALRRAPVRTILRRVPNAGFRLAEVTGVDFEARRLETSTGPLDHDRLILVLHIWILIGFHNRLVVLIHWAWDYVLYDRAVRLITRPESAPRDEERVEPSLGAAGNAGRR